MRHRLIMGAIRYGPFRRTDGFDYQGYLAFKIDEYYRTGNLEMLVDTANMAMLAWKAPRVDRRPLYVHDVLRSRLVGWLDTRLNIPPLDKLYQTQWDSEFEKLMTVVYHDVKRVCREHKVTLNFFNVAMQQCSHKHAFVAALAWHEFENSQHPAAHWHAVDRK